MDLINKGTNSTVLKTAIAVMAIAKIKEDLFVERYYNAWSNSDVKILVFDKNVPIILDANKIIVNDARIRKTIAIAYAKYCGEKIPQEVLKNEAD